MSPPTPDTPDPASQPLPTNVKVLGGTSLLNDIASEMIYPLLPTFLITVLGGNKFHLGIIEGAADSLSSFLKLWSGGQSERAGRRKGFVLFGYGLATITRPLLGLVTAPWHRNLTPLRAPPAGKKTGRGALLLRVVLMSHQPSSARSEFRTLQVSDLEHEGGRQGRELAEAG